MDVYENLMCCVVIACETLDEKFNFRIWWLQVDVMWVLAFVWDLVE